MPATTPNRGYQYPLAGDPVRIPQDLQTLAEDIDDDVCALTQNIPLRYAFRVRGSAAQTVVTGGVFNPDNLLTFDTIDFCTGDNPTFGNEGRIVVPALTGFYFVVGTCAYPRPTAGGSRNRYSLFVRRNVLPAFNIEAASDNASTVSASDQIRTLYAAGSMSTTGGAGFVLDFQTELTAGGTDTFTIGERTLTFIRMSPTP